MREAEPIASVEPGLPPLSDALPAPVGGPTVRVRDWFDDAAEALIPNFDGTLATARAAATAYARHAKADNTRRAYRAGVRAWCAWCDRHGLPALPARAGDVVAFLADERGRGLSVSAVELRRASIRYLHFIAGCAVPTAEAQVAGTMAGIRRAAGEAGDRPVQKIAATIGLLRELLAPIQEDLRGWRDRALLLVGFAGALRRAELAALRLEHVETTARGLRLALPRSKGDRSGRGVTVAIPYGSTDLCPVRALQTWVKAAGHTEGPVFRRLWQPPHAVGAAPPPAALGWAPLDPRSVARIIQHRARAAGFDGASWGGHSLTRGALTTGMDRGVHPTRLKQLGRHKTYAVLDAYLELGDPFDGHPLRDVF